MARCDMMRAMFTHNDFKVNIYTKQYLSQKILNNRILKRNYNDDWAQIYILFIQEKSARVVHFPGVSALTFHQLLHYIYTDGTPPKVISVYILIATRNR